jgi:hypothetical protein
MPPIFDPPSIVTTDATSGVLYVSGGAQSATTCPCIAFGGIGSSSIKNFATIQAEDYGNYVCDLTFYTRIGSTSFDLGGASAATEKLRVRSGVSNTTGTTIKVSGICEASAGFNVSSALKYKKNIQELPDNYNLDMLMKYRPIIYNLKDDDSKTLTYFPGFIAEEVEELGAKLFVTYKDNKPNALDYSRICVHLVKCMQEIKQTYDAKIIEIENKYDSKLEEMQKKIDVLIESSVKKKTKVKKEPKTKEPQVKESEITETEVKKTNTKKPKTKKEPKTK